MGTSSKLAIRIDGDNGVSLTTCFANSPGLPIERMIVEDHRDSTTTVLEPDLSATDIAKILPKQFRDAYKSFGGDWNVYRNRCFLEIGLTSPGLPGGAANYFPGTNYSAPFVRLIRDLIHIPGLRGNPARTYPVGAVGPIFQGTFERYAASVIASWQTQGEKEKLNGVNEDLRKLGLTWKVRAEPKSDTEVELVVGRLPRAARGGAWDLVSIADVGFGVSQTLPVLVAMRAASRDQLIYIEQPEIHLHPKAQSLMAEVIVNAILNGKRVVIETHSATLLVSIQTLIAQGKLDPKMVAFHWFKRTEDGDTCVTTAEIDEAGSFGDWPEDFGEVLLETERAYLDAAEKARSQNR